MFFRKKRVLVPPTWWVRVNEWQLKYAHRLANWLARKTAKIPPSRLRVCVVLFLLGMAGVNLILVGHAMHKHTVRGAIPTMDRPAQVIVTQPHSATRVDLGRVLDSLRRDSLGGRVFDSLLKARPGLADTLKRLGMLN